jgi:hypothetical protein
MSLERLDRAIAGLPARAWTVRDLEGLRAAAGERVNGDERARFAELLAGRWQRFSEPARRALEVLVGQAAPDLAPTALRVAGRYQTGIAEQSALAFVSPAAGFLLIDDERAQVWRLPMPEGREAPQVEGLRGAPPRADLEGVAWDADTRSVLTLDEMTGTVSELPAQVVGDSLELGRARRLGRLPEIGHEENKGWEGLAVLPAAHAPDRRARVVAVHEGSPVALAVFDRKTLRLEAHVELPAAMQPRDLSDLAFDPKTGRFFLLSDESHCLWEVELRRTTKLLGAGPPASSWALVAIRETKLPRDEVQPEGVAVDHRGDVWVSFEARSALLRLERAAR